MSHLACAEQQNQETESRSSSTASAPRAPCCRPLRRASPTPRASFSGATTISISRARAPRSMALRRSPASPTRCSRSCACRGGWSRSARSRRGPRRLRRHMARERPASRRHRFGGLRRRLPAQPEQPRQRLSSATRRCLSSASSRWIPSPSTCPSVRARGACAGRLHRPDRPTQSGRCRRRRGRHHRLRNPHQPRPPLFPPLRRRLSRPANSNMGKGVSVESSRARRRRHRRLVRLLPCRGRP